VLATLLIAVARRLRVARRTLWLLYGLLLGGVLGCSPSPPPSGGAASQKSAGAAPVRVQQAAMVGAVSPEIFLSAPTFGGTNAADSPGVATDGTSFLVVFHDSTIGRAPGRAVLVSSSGSVASPLGVDLPGGTNPAVASGASEYLVVWDELGNIRGARVGRTGQLMDAQGFVIASGTTDTATQPKVAWCGASYLVTWLTDLGVFGVHVDSTGTVIDAQPFEFRAVFPDGGSRNNSSGLSTGIASNGDECLVAWTHGSVWVSRVGSQGPPLDDPGIELRGTVTQWPTVLGVASNGADFVVAHGTTQSNLFQAQRVDSRGIVLDGVPMTLQSATTTSNIPGRTPPAMTWDGHQYVIAWADTTYIPGTENTVTTLLGATLSAAGVPAAAPTTILTPFRVKGAPGLASGTNGAYFVWSNGQNVLGSLLDSTLTLSEPLGTLLSARTDFQSNVQLASSGTGYFAAWRDARNGQDDIYGTRLGAEGQPLDLNGIAIANGANAESSPAVAYDGTAYLVAWFEMVDPTYSYTVVKGARVGQDGKIIRSIDFKSGADVNGGLAVACTATECLVTWTVQSASYGDRNIAGAILDANGKATGIPISTAVIDEVDPAVATDGTDFLVVWTATVGTVQNIHGARIRADGVPLDKGIPLSTATDLSEVNPSVTYDPVGLTYLVAWERAGDIRGTRAVAQNDVLTPLDPAPNLAIAVLDGSQTAPRVVYSGDGHNALAVWQQQGIGADAPDIYGAWIASGGKVFGAGPIAAAASSETLPAVASSGSGKVLVAYQINDAANLSPTVGRLGARIVTASAQDGTACTQDGACASGKCRDGYCCQRECDTSCETCGDPKSPGICTCTGRSECTTSSTKCAKTLGIECTTTAECATGFSCADGFCCDTACDGACESCDLTPGTCSPRAKGSLGRSRADGGAGCTGGYLCDGAQRSCPTTCQSDDDCGGGAHGYYCEKSACVGYCLGDTDCPTSPTKQRCNVSQGKCFAGPRCEQDQRGQYKITEPGVHDRLCGGYVCAGENACLTTCTSNAQCSPGNSCDATGACSIPPEALTARVDPGCGCKTAPRPAPIPPAWLWASVALCVGLVARRRPRGA
jgi:hypothetical protein